MAKPYRLGPPRRVVNTVMAALLRFGMGGKLMYLLSTTGRRTGQKRTTPVILLETDAGCWPVSPHGPVSSWVHNVRAQPEVTLRRGKRTEVLRAEEIGSDAPLDRSSSSPDPTHGHWQLCDRIRYSRVRTRSALARHRAGPAAGDHLPAITALSSSSDSRISFAKSC